MVCMLDKRISPFSQKIEFNISLKETVRIKCQALLLNAYQICQEVSCDEAVLFYASRF